MPQKPTARIEQKLSRIYLYTGTVFGLFVTLVLLAIGVGSFINFRVDALGSYSKLADADITENIQEIVTDLQVIEDYSPAKILIESPSNTLARAQLEDLFVDLLEHDYRYYQLRYIQADGQEVLKVTRSNLDYEIEVVSQQDLQNKSSTSYHRDISSLETSDIYISRIELNREFGLIEEPYQPVLRIALPIFTDGSLNGYFIANVRADRIISRAVGSRSDVFLVTEDGYYLYADDTTKLFGDRENLGTGENFFKDVPKIRDYLVEDSAGTYVIGTRLYTHRRLFEGLETPHRPILVSATPILALLGPLLLVVFLSLVALTIAIYVTYSLVRSRIKEFLFPIRVIQRALLKIRSGDYSINLPPFDAPEFKDIGDSVNNMAQVIRDNKDTLTTRIDEQTAEIRHQLEKLQSQQERLQQFEEAVQKSANGVFLTDTDGVVTFANDSMEASTGYAVSEIVGKKAGSLWGGKMSKDFYAKMWHQVKVEKQFFKDTLEGVKKNGDRVFYELSISPILDDNGNIKYFLAIQNDISRGVRAERLSNTLKTQYEEAFNNSSIGVALVSPEGDWLQVNDALVEIVGYPREQLLEKSFQDITHPDDLQKDLDLVQKTLNGEIKGYKMEKRYIRSDGGTVWVLLTVSLVTDADGKPQYFISQIQDINDQKFHEARLKESNETKSKFVTIVAHQLRTPLASIRWNLENLLSGDFGKLPKEHEALVQAIYEAEVNIVDRLDDLLVVMDIDEGKASLSKETAAIATTFEVARSELTERVMQKKIKFSTSFDNVPDFEFDREKITKVFEVLLENAVDYTAEGGSIEATLKSKDGNVEFSIKDTGIGIPDSEKNRVMRKFYRATNAFTSETDRSGIGLYIAKFYVELHGGSIGFTSEEGHGSVFWFNLPLPDNSNAAVTTIA